MRPIATLVCFLLLSVSACAEEGSGPIVSSGDRYAIASVDAPSGPVADYRLGVGDRIKVAVFSEPTLSGEFSVSANGTVSLPLIGEVPAGGRTVNEVAIDARNRLADGYLRDPKLSAEVTVYRPFYILGEVVQAGQYPYAVRLTVLNAVAMAKGFTARADRNVAHIRRQGETKEMVYRLTPELTVYPGDTVRIGERFF